MSSINLPKSSYKHPYGKSVSPTSNNISHDESELSVRTNETPTPGNSYTNTPSPSSIASTSTINHRPRRHRRPSTIRLQADLQSPMSSSKRRFRHEKLFHYTHSLNRQYIVTMTNILFQMQKEIYKLNKRTRRVEQILENQRQQSSRPTIRIPRLTKGKTDDITTMNMNDENNEQEEILPVSEENDNNQSESFPVISNPSEPSSVQENNLDHRNSIETTDQTKNSTKRCFIKFCNICNYEFSHRSAYLRHMKNIHRIRVTDLHPNSSNEIDHNPTPASPIADELENETTAGSLQILINQWDVGEGRLRPRPAPKITTSESSNKVKCDICHKYFRAAYIQKHKRRTHRPPKASSSNEGNQLVDDCASTPAKSIATTPGTFEDSSSTIINTDPPSGIAIAEMDTDDMPIQFRKESTKEIVIASTCLKPDHIEIFEEFLQKFSPRVRQSPAVDSHTTHLITNDDEHPLHSPLSMKLIEGIANHCFCLSYRWIVDCVKYDRIIDEDPYEIEGDDTPNHAIGGPKRSRTADKRHALFEKNCFMIKCTEDKDIRMTNDRLQDLIVTCGGRIIDCVTQELLNQSTIVVLCDRLYVSERRHNYHQCKGLGIHFVSSDWVLESILEYRLQPYAAYEEKPI